MPVLNVRSAGDIRQAMIDAARAEFERITGLSWPVTALDPQVLSYGVVANAIVELEELLDEVFNGAVAWADQPAPRHMGSHQRADAAQWRK